MLKRLHDGELLSLLLSPCKAVVDMIAAKGILCLTNRDDINTLAWLQSQLPVIVGHTCNNMIVGELPVFADMTVFYPDIRILLCECKAFCTKIDGWGFLSWCIIFRWSFSRFCIRIVDEIISRDVPK